MMPTTKKAEDNLAELTDEQLDDVHGGLFEGCYKYENRQKKSIMSSGDVSLTKGGEREQDDKILMKHGEGSV